MRSADRALGDRQPNPRLLRRHEGLDLDEVHHLAADKKYLTLWNHTLDFASRGSPYYRKLLPPHIEDLSQVNSIPVLDAETFGRHWDSICCSGADSDVIFFSGGTTGQQKRFDSDCREEMYLNHLRLLSLDAADQANDSGPDLLEGRAITNAHGASPAIPKLGRLRRLQIPLVETFQFEQALRIASALGRDNHKEQLVYVRGTSETIRALSCFGAEVGFDAAQLAINQLRVGGTAITPRWRRHLEQLWQAPVRELFGATEFYQSYATECLDCGWHHYQLWSVYPEVVALDSLNGPAPTRPAPVGELVLSHFVPFALRQPLLRYRTGDLVQQGGICDTTGHRQFRFGGRLRNILIPPQPDASALEDFTLNSCQVKFVVDELPGVARAQDSYAKSGIYHHNTYGDAIWERHSGSHRYGIDIAGDVNAMPPPDEIHRRLVQNSPALARWEAEGNEFVVNTVGLSEFDGVGMYI